EARYFPSAEKSRPNTASLCTLVNDCIGLVDNAAPLPGPLPIGWGEGALCPADSSVASATCQILISPPRVGSPPPVANCLPSGLKRTALTRSLMGDEASPVPMVRSRVQPGFRSQTNALRSAAPETKVPLPAKASAKTGPLWPLNVSMAVPLSAFHV